jgi:endonuclease/exonuclease/phosphatase family metal-dependent hydrolase
MGLSNENIGATNTIITWNMQGAGGIKELPSSDTVNKWNELKIYIRKNKPKVFCLQECGGVPIDYESELFSWDVQQIASSDRHIPIHYNVAYYNVKNQSKGFRCNLAVGIQDVGKQPIVKIFPSTETKRAAIFVSNDNRTYYGSMHASSGGTNSTISDILYTLIDVKEAFENKLWYLAGDFNYQPTDEVKHKKETLEFQDCLSKHYGCVIHSSGTTTHNTHKSGRATERELDYLITPNTINKLCAATQGLQSDHTAVAFYTIS